MPEAGGADTNGVPAHVAVIMDGNGRWARKRMLTEKAGHRAGAQALKKIAAQAESMGIKVLTAYAFSTENWKRPPEEVDGLMDLLRGYIQQYIDDKDKNDMRLSVIGRRDRLPKDLAESIAGLERMTAGKPGLRLIIALDYGARDEIARAVKKIARNVLNNTVSVNNIDEELIAGCLDTNGLPDPELLIRTGGELRASNFLLWQMAYTEFYFSDKLWPDFNANDLREAVRVYQLRERRFGGRET